MSNTLSEFIYGSLSPQFPPTNPILRDGWAGLAFDRNLHENLAPDDVWGAVLATHAGNAKDPQAIGVISFEELQRNHSGRFFPATMAELRKYWIEGASFLTDHYIFSPSHEWLIRLDQDVTLITGELSFINKVVNKIGGLDRVMAKMIDEFDPGEEDAAGLNRYLQSITAPIARIQHK